MPINNLSRVLIFAKSDLESSFDFPAQVLMSILRVKLFESRSDTDRADQSLVSCDVQSLCNAVQALFWEVIDLARCLLLAIIASTHCLDLSISMLYFGLNLAVVLEQPSILDLKLVFTIRVIQLLAAFLLFMLLALLPLVMLLLLANLSRMLFSVAEALMLFELTFRIALGLFCLLKALGLLAILVTFLLDQFVASSLLKYGLLQGLRNIRLLLLRSLLLVMSLLTAVIELFDVSLFVWLILHIDDVVA